MEARKLYRAFVLICCLIAILLGLAYAQYAQFRNKHHYKNFSEQIISDAECIKRAKQIPEVKLFLKIYPEAKPVVDRSGGLGVSFRVDESIPLNPPDNHDYKYVRLGVPIDLSTLKVEDDIFLEHRKEGRSIIIRRPNIVDELKRDRAIKEKSLGKD